MVNYLHLYLSIYPYSWMMIQLHIQFLLDNFLSAHKRECLPSYVFATMKLVFNESIIPLWIHFSFNLVPFKEFFSYFCFSSLSLLLSYLILIVLNLRILFFHEFSEKNLFLIKYLSFLLSLLVIDSSFSLKSYY